MKIPAWSYHQIVARQRIMTALANLFGALLTFIFLAAIDTPSDRPASRSISLTSLLAVAGFVALAFIVLTILTGWHWKSLNDWARKMGPGVRLPVAIQRRVLNTPPLMAVINIIPWLIAGVVFNAVPELASADQTRLFLDIAGVGGVVTSAVIYYATDLIWQPAVLLFFPDGDISAAGALRRSILFKLVSAFILIGIGAPALLAHLAISKASLLVGAANPAAVLDNLKFGVGFTVAVSMASSLAIGSLVGRSIVFPIRRLRQATSAVHGQDLNVWVPVTTNDELGYLAEGFNEMVAGLRERARIRDMFGQYVTAQVAEAVLNGDVKLGGERRDVTILMTDIRSFTTLSENVSPEEVVALLNAYFSTMIDAIIEFDGTLDKFVGDAIMVEFNIPLPTSNHALRAVLTALRMRQNLVSFNQSQKAANRPEIRIGMGVHTGPAVVGNIGAEGKKLEYTAIGDTVNVASRLEDFTKQLTHDICISEDVYTQVAKWVEVGEPISANVKGRDAAVTVYRLIGLKAGLELGAELVPK